VHFMYHKECSIRRVSCALFALQGMFTLWVFLTCTLCVNQEFYVSDFSPWATAATLEVRDTAVIRKWKFWFFKL
jgi:hypothetical protein